MADLGKLPPPPVPGPDDREPEWSTAFPDPARPRPTGQDPVAVIAVGAGFLGIVFFGILAAVVAGVLGAVAGQRARESGRSFELPYLAFGLAFVDGVVWLVMQTLFEVPIWIG